MEVPIYCVNLLNVINAVVRLDETEIQSLCDKVVPVTFKKGEYLLSKDGNAGQVWFINKGLCAYTVIRDNGSEVVLFFAQESDFVCELYGFHFGVPAINNILALEDGEGVLISKDVVNWFQEKVPGGMKVSKHTIEYNLARIFKRFSKEAEAYGVIEMYKELVVEFPDIEQRVSQKVIASYLGVSSIHLSRLKSKVYKKV